MQTAISTQFSTTIQYSSRSPCVTFTPSWSNSVTDMASPLIGVRRTRKGWEGVPSLLCGNAAYLLARYNVVSSNAAQYTNRRGMNYSTHQTILLSVVLTTNTILQASEIWIVHGILVSYCYTDAVLKRAAFSLSLSPVLTAAAQSAWLMP